MNLSSLKRFLVVAASGVMLFQTTAGCLTTEQGEALVGLGKMILAVIVSVGLS